MCFNTIFRKISYSLVFLLTCFNPVFAASNVPCSPMPRWIQTFCQHLKSVIYEGTPDLYLSGYAWHNRFTYSREKINSYNEAAWGGGLGKSIFDEKGNWHSLAAIAFLDSHKRLEPAAGYTYLKVFPLLDGDELKIGGGLSFLVTARSDLNNGYPLPGILPWASLFYKKLALSATYIPAPRNKGNVLFLLSKISLDI